MKTTSNAIKIASQICWLCVHVAIALWAISWSVRLVQNLRLQFSNSMMMQGTIV